MAIDNKSKLESDMTFKISRFKEVIKRTKPHKHSGYYELIFIMEGEGFHTIDTVTHTISAPEFYMLSAGQLHCWQFTAIPKGFVILLKEEEFDKISESNSLHLLAELKSITQLSLNNKDSFIAILEDMYLAYKECNDYSTIIIHGLLTALFAKLLSLSKIANQKPRVATSKIYEDFITLVSNDVRKSHKVNEYASALNTTPQNLNALCRKYSGKSASEIVVTQLILEAKRYILHSDNTIFEIAETLGFEDVSNFVKYFKRYEKITPKQFRLKYFQ